MTRRRWTAAAIGVGVAATAAFYLTPGLHRNAPAPRSAPLTAEQSLATMQVADGFTIEIVATEPTISSPVAMDIDEDGRIFVVEMPGYPLDTSASGRVTLLEDTDGDGRIDRSGVFADGLVLPTGVMRWKRGVLVTAAPDVLYLEDTNGDGRADVRSVVLTGFAFTNPQHTVNSPRYGLDNWIYLAHEGPAEAVIFKERFGDEGRPLRFPDRPDAPLDAGRRSVRFRPGTHEIEARAGSSQFGHAFDEWGRYFTLDNSNHSRHEVIASRYLARNPDLLAARAMQNISDHGAAATVYPISSRPRLELLSEPGQFTSACSLTIDLGGRLSPPGQRVAFVAEPVHNLVHRDAISPAGATFVSRRMEEGREFLASSDPWFRPVNFYVGPDGALFVVDYYREMIEHPEWTSSEHHHHSGDLYRGRDRGRIYRVAPAGSAPPAARPKLSVAPTSELVTALGHENAWWRLTAQRLLVDRRDAAAIPLLRKLAERRPTPLARLHALWTLDALGALDPKLVEQGLADEQPGVRENAIRLADARLDVPAIQQALFRLAADPDARVRFQLLCTVGSLNTAESRRVQERLLRENIEDEWVQVAALSAGSDRAVEYFDRALAGSGRADRDTAGRRAFVARVSAVLGARGRAPEIERVVSAAAGDSSARPEWFRAATLEGLARGFRARRPRRDALDGVQRMLLALFDTSSPPIRRAALNLLEVSGVTPGPGVDEALARAARIASRPDADPQLRADAAGLLAAAGPERLRSTAPLLQALVEPRQPEAVQAAAVRALGATDDDAVAAFVLARWRDMTPAVRREAAEALLKRPARTRALIDALQKGQVPAWTLDFWQTRDLLMHSDPTIRDAARALLEEKPEERAQRTERLDAALTLDGNAARGEGVFRELCAKCHVMNGAGAAVGPDLGTVRGRPASVLLADILWPNRSIAAGYEAYVVERASGGVEHGVLAAQTPTGVVLRQEEGRDRVIPRDDIAKMYSSTLSAMPADLDRALQPQQLADLVAFLKSARPARERSTPGQGSR
jgi:putative membrane-bound dehydrogenase-like protein